MFNPKVPHDDMLNERIATVLEELTKHEPTSQEYATTMERLDKLYELRQLNAPKPIDPNTLLLIGGNLAVVLVIVGFERANVITSKALSFVRPK